MRHSTPMPGDPAPTLTVETIGGAPIDLAAETPETLTVVLFYRGLHCPLCRQQLEELNKAKTAYEEAGITIHAVSMDSRERAQQQKDEWAIDALTIGYGLSEASAREWGLFISGKDKDAEPERFAEPGTAVIDRDGRLYVLFIQNVPFARPMPDQLLPKLKFLLENAYPIRGRLAA